MLDFETCNAARLRRDPSFDGRFFTAVSTTRIYCRPVCPAKHSLTKNVSYYPTAAAAEAARNTGAGRALIEAVADAARTKGADQLYWHTEDHNKRAHYLYDKVADKTEFIKYKKLL